MYARNADSIIVGAGAGASTAAGIQYGGKQWYRYHKIDVNGDNAIPLYKWLTSNTKFEGFNGPAKLFLTPIVKKMDSDYKNNGNIKWNFTKFLIGKDGDIVHNIQFMGGCNGNLKAISLLLEGWTVENIEKKLSGVLCGRRPTSCSDQLAKAVRAAYDASLEQNYTPDIDED